MKKNISFQTQNKEIYEKINFLNIVDEVVLEKSSIRNLNKLIKSNLVDVRSLPNNMLLVKKKTPVNFNVYMNKN
jgi:hypothetical protein